MHGGDRYWARLGVRYYYAEGPGTGPVKDGFPIGPGPGTDMEELKVSDSLQLLQKPLFILLRLHTGPIIDKQVFRSSEIRPIYTSALRE